MPFCPGDRKALISRSLITFIIIHVILRQLLLVAFLLLIPCVHRLEETDQKLVTVDPTALHQNQKGKKYLQKLASVQERHAW